MSTQTVIASLTTHLKNIGKDLNAVATWIETAMKLVGGAATVLDPPLGPIISAVELAIQDIQAVSNVPITAATTQAITSAVTTLMALKVKPTTVVSIASGAVTTSTVTT